MTRPGIEPRSLGTLANTLLTRPMARSYMKVLIFIDMCKNTSQVIICIGHIYTSAKISFNYGNWAKYHFFFFAFKTSRLKFWYDLIMPTSSVTVSKVSVILPGDYPDNDCQRKQLKNWTTIFFLFVGLNFQSLFHTRVLFAIRNFTDTPDISSKMVSVYFQEFNKALLFQGSIYFGVGIKKRSNNGKWFQY